MIDPLAEYKNQINSFKIRLPHVVDTLVKDQFNDFHKKPGPDSYAVTKVAVSCIAEIKTSWPVDGCEGKREGFVVTSTISASENHPRERFLLSLKSDSEIEITLRTEMEDEALEHSKFPEKEEVDTRVEHELNEIKKIRNRTAHLKSLLINQVDKLAEELIKSSNEQMRKHSPGKTDIKQEIVLSKMGWTINISNGSCFKEISETSIF